MNCTCGNVARYVDTNGKWWCALCCMGVCAVRAIDVSKLVQMADWLLIELDKQMVSAGTSYRQEIRGMLGRFLGTRFIRTPDDHDMECNVCGGSIIEREHAMSNCPGPVITESK